MAAPQVHDTDVHKRGEDQAGPSSSPPPSSLPIYHEQFAREDDDFVLESLEGTLYRVNSYTLRTTCGLFRTMLSLPCPPDPSQDPSQRTTSTPTSTPTHPPLAIHQPDAVLVPLLCLMSGLPEPALPTLADIAAVLHLAEIWDAPGPIAFLRPAVCTPAFLASDPLRVYALAAHFGWRAEAQAASTHTLRLNLLNPSSPDALADTDIPGCALLPLLALHRTRRDTLRALLDSPERFLAGNGSPFFCATCATTPLDNRSWRELKARVFKEMEARPLGDMLGVPVGGMAAWEESKACWAAVCTKADCSAANYDRVATLRQMRSCVDSLPCQVEVDWLAEDI
ncbi:unnamed protein product [Mycena citricolor]|uniref:BTB domain-containing protein n=1 Tax=Mycena citricolor TaxID=2018698 RepID=A0AAD2H760_9AGAR|nr:unnamed protein product [Mycena citricolor]